MFLVNRAVRFFIFLIFFTAFVALSHRAKADEVPQGADQSATQMGIQLKVDAENGPVIFIGEAGQVAIDPQAPLVVNHDLEARVQANELSPEQAQAILSELHEFDGAYYGFPGVEELKLTLGFPGDAQLLQDDLHALARVHIQVTLGTSPLTSSYLAESLDLKPDIKSASYQTEQ